MLDSSGPEGVSCSDHHLLAHRLVSCGKLADGGGLANSVHTDNHHDKRLLRKVERFFCRCSAIDIEKDADFFTKELHQFVVCEILVSLDTGLQAVNDLQSRFHADVRGY